LDPIALISGDKLVRPPVGDMNDSAANVFRHTFYGRGQSYRVVGGGEDLGIVGAAAAIDPGCFGLEADAHVKLARPAPQDLMLFATNAARIRGGDAIRRPLSGEDREVLYSHISQVLADSGVPPAFRGHSFMIAGARIESPEANPFIIGMFKVDSTENGGARIISVLLGLDSTSSGYRPTLLTYYNGLDADAAGERFVDILEIDGSPPPELITRTTFYESYTYTVYRKTPSGWQSWYTGGGGGC